MTAISGNSIALSILSQASPASRAASGSAADEIMNIVSGRSGKTAGVGGSAVKAIAAQKADTPRAVGGTVSSEISSAQMSAMSAIGAARTGTTSDGISYDDPRIAFTPMKATVEEGEAITVKLARSVMDYNEQFKLKQIPSREEHEASKEGWLAQEQINGSSDKQIAFGLELNFGEGGYERNVRWITQDNASALKESELAAHAMVTMQQHLKDVFNVNTQITFGEDGRATLESFDILSSSGQKMVSYGSDVSVKSFNSDGTDRIDLEASKTGRRYFYL